MFQNSKEILIYDLSSYYIADIKYPHPHHKKKMVIQKMFGSFNIFEIAEGPLPSRVNVKNRFLLS